MNSKWLAIILLLSLAINLALGGFIAGRTSGFGPAHDPSHMFPRWVRTLPEPRRDELRPLIREHFKHMRPHLGQMRDSRRAVHQAIVADKFDAQQLQQALAAMRAAQNEVFDNNDQAFVRFVGQLSKTERQQLAERPRRGDHPPSAIQRPDKKPAAKPF